MKFIKRLFGKKEGSSEGTGLREIDFEDLPAWLDNNYQKISSGMEKDISGLLRELEVSLSRLKESTSRLVEAKVEGDFDIRAVKRAKSNRENVTKQVSMLIDKIKVQENKDFRALKGFYEISVQNIDSCLEHMNQSFKYTRGVFPQESKEVSENLASLGQIFNELRKAILENKREMEAIETAFSDIKVIQDLSASMVTEKLELESKNRKIQALRDEASRASQALEEFRKGDTWQNLQSMQEEFNAVRNRLKKTESGLTSLVLPLSGHLSRIKKLHESGRYTLNSEVKKQLDICLEDPIHLDPSFFPELQKVFEDNALDMQTQKKEKALQQVINAISVFPERKKEYLEVLQEFEEKKAELAGSDTGKLVMLEHKETELLNRTCLLEEDIKDSEKKQVALREELDSKEKQLLFSINLVDSSVKVHFQY
ncbi:MAG: cell surface protein [Methanosarcina sp.]|uniref:cell surface protein n=1 Tax=Methanosarcina sp. TaxID=2213 RepID=UPI003BB5098E